MRLKVWQRMIALILVPLLYQLALLAAISVLGSQLEETIWWENHSEEVLLSCSRLEGAITAIQASVRGYVFMDSAGFRQEKDSSLAHLKTETDHLMKLVEDNPEQEPRAIALGTQADHIVQWYQQTVETYDRGHREDAVARLKSLEGNRQVNEFESSLNNFLEIETSLSDQRRSA